MIFTVLGISFTKEELRKLISMTDTNMDGKIDVKEFHKMLYAEDLEARRAALRPQEESSDEDIIQVVEEVSGESGDEDDEIKQEIKAEVLANRKEVLGGGPKQKTSQSAAADKEDEINEEVIEEDVIDEAPMAEDSIQEESMNKNDGFKLEDDD